MLTFAHAGVPLQRLRQRVGSENGSGADLLLGKRTDATKLREAGSGSEGYPVTKVGQREGIYRKRSRYDKAMTWRCREATVKPRRAEIGSFQFPKILGITKKYGKWEQFRKQEIF